MKMITDTQILNAIKNGENSVALKYLYSRCLPKIKSLIMTNNGSEDDALDVFQDSVIILMRTIKTGRFNTNNDIDGFMYVIARNQWINKVKKEKRNTQYENNLEYDNHYDDDIQRNIELKEREQGIKDMLAKLGKKCFDILKSIIFEGSDYKEIAEQIGLASGNVVKTYKNRCKKKLLDLLHSNKELRNSLLRHERGFEKHI